MKNNATKFHTVLIATILAFSACNNSGNNGAQNGADSVMAKVDTAAQDIKQGAENAVNKVENAMSSNPDSDFVVKAATTNNAELRILQAGFDNGTNKELKTHARMMLADHKKLGDKVKSYSDKKNYTLPADDNGKANDELAKLNEKTKGADWDIEWVDHMVSAHEDAISMFEKGRDNVKDADLRNIINDALPTLHAHLEMMKNLRDRMTK